MNKTNLSLSALKKFLIILGCAILLPFILEISILPDNLLYPIFNVYYYFVECFFDGISLKDGLTLYYTVIGIIVNIVVLFFYWKAHYDINVKPKLDTKNFIEKNFIFNLEDTKRHENIHKELTRMLTEQSNSTFKKTDYYFFSEVFSKEMLCNMFSQIEDYTYLSFLEKLLYLNNNFSEVIITPNKSIEKFYNYSMESNLNFDILNRTLSFENYEILKSNISEINKKSYPITYLNYLNYIKKNYELYLARKNKENFKKLFVDNA